MASSISTMTTITGSKNSYNCVIPIVDTIINNISSRNEKIRISTHNQFYSNNFTTPNLGSYGNYFGTGKDGDVTLSSSAQISASFNNTLDGDFVIKNYNNLTLNSGVLLTPLKRCRGLIIYCTGNLTVAGTLSMTGKGGGVGNKIATPIGGARTTEARYDLIDGSLYFNNFSSSANNAYGTLGHWNWAPSGSSWFSSYKIRIRLSGSVAGGQSPSSNGTAGIFCGGGGGSGADGYSTAGGKNGGRGTIFSGGGGGGGLGRAPAPTNGTAGVFEVGGNGGDTQNGSTSHGGGGGAGSPPGAAGPSPISGNIATAGGEGVGGLLICIVRGNISITGTGTISNNGSVGGTGSGGGGGSGGGVILLIYGGTYSNSGTVVANGGAGGPGSGGGTGGTGGAGAITIRKIHS